MPLGLIFDCDGTLADTMPVHYRAWCETLAPYGLTFSEERFYEWGGVPTRDIIARLSNEAAVSLDIDAVSTERDSAFLRLAQTVTILPVEPVLRIAEAHRGRLPLAVATGGTHRQVNGILDALNIREWFDAIVAAEDVARPKPAPDVFLEAARRLGVPPGECEAYEDGDAGLEAARAAGMAVVDVRVLLRR